jgi:hypothetical protein
MVRTDAPDDLHELARDLQDGLDLYGAHLRDCADGNGGGPCDCGLTDLLVRAEQKLGPVEDSLKRPYLR